MRFHAAREKNQNFFKFFLPNLLTNFHAHDIIIVSNMREAQASPKEC
jgi:hypothetical protein